MTRNSDHGPTHETERFQAAVEEARARYDDALRKQLADEVADVTAAQDDLRRAKQAQAVYLDSAGSS